MKNVKLLEKQLKEEEELSLLNSQENEYRDEMIKENIRKMRLKKIEELHNKQTQQKLQVIT